MGAVGMPPSPPAIVAPAPECRYLTQAEADTALARLRRTLPSTSFDEALPSAVCGMVIVRLKSGKVAYTDATGRYLMLAMTFDTHTGSAVETSEAIDNAIERRGSAPNVPPQGVSDDR